nr:MAG: capsid protein [Totivirus sp. 'monocotyledonae']
MDTLVKRFFPAFQAPGMMINTDRVGTTYAYMANAVVVQNANVSEETNRVEPPRHMFSTQPMTSLGLMEASISGTVTSLDGLTKNYLTPEGTVNLSMLAETLKQSAGLQTAMWSGHVGKMQQWSWADNHVPLLLNMLRHAFLMSFSSAGLQDNLNLGNYNDGHVTVNRDQWWPENYPAAHNVNSWPGGNADENYPNYVRLAESVPSEEYSAVDLRGLNNDEARAVLLMLGKWRRRSRFRCDYETPKLVDNVYYRFPRDVPNLDEWLEPEGGVQPGDGALPAAPAVPNAKLIWSALRKYVGQNRLFDHFSVALYIFCATTYQFLPVTAEGNYWLSMNWTMHIPEFKSIRGRYSCINEGDPAYVSHRALNEWGYINGAIEKVNLMALVTAQAMQTGMAVRSVRKGLELDPNDLFSSEPDFYHSENFIAASIAEALRSDSPGVPGVNSSNAPLAGMPEVFLQCSENFDHYSEERVVMSENLDPDGLEGYDFEMREVRGVAVVTETWVDPDHAPGLQQAEKDAKRLELRAIAAGARAKAAVLPTIVLTDEEKNALNGLFKSRREQVRVVQKAFIRTPWITFAGLPTLIMPLNPFPYNNPFSMKGEISPDLGQLKRKGFKMESQTAWFVANLFRICGYDLTAEIHNTAGAKSYFAPNNVNFVWPVMHKKDLQDTDALLLEQTMRNQHWIDLPPVINKFFDKKKIVFRIDVKSRGVAANYNMHRRDVGEFGGAVTLQPRATVSYSVADNIARLRGYINRSAEGFRFVGGVQGGVIPPIDPAPPAPPVAPATQAPPGPAVTSAATAASTGAAPAAEGATSA